VDAALIGGAVILFLFSGFIIITPIVAMFILAGAPFIINPIMRKRFTAVG